MNNTTNTKMVKQQYKNADHLNTRISIHDKYSTNKQGFANWIYSNYEIHSEDNFLELGCGTGSMWKEHLELLKNSKKAILSDFSQGMIETAKTHLGTYSNVDYKVVDIQNIPYENESFDLVIANMMLYHVPDLQKGLSEVKRVLKQGGKFYCATYGVHGILEYVARLFNEENVINTMNQTFTLQNGYDTLKSFFSNVKKLEYIDSLEVTNIDDMVDYLDSYSNMSNLIALDHDTIRSVLTDNMVNGVLKVPKEYGMFVSIK